jgi:hypothetical protein
MEKEENTHTHTQAKIPPKVHHPSKFLCPKPMDYNRQPSAPDAVAYPSEEYPKTQQDQVLKYKLND